MPQVSKQSCYPMIVGAGLLAWFVPGAGHFLLGEKKRAVIIFITLVLTFAMGLYLGSIAVVDPISSKPWFFAQFMCSPLVTIVGEITVKNHYSVFGWPNEVGQIYTSTAGLLNLLCIVNAAYLAHLKAKPATGA